MLLRPPMLRLLVLKKTAVFQCIQAQQQVGGTGERRVRGGKSRRSGKFCKINSGADRCFDHGGVRMGFNEAQRNVRHQPEDAGCLSHFQRYRMSGRRFSDGDALVELFDQGGEDFRSCACFAGYQDGDRKIEQSS